MDRKSGKSFRNLAYSSKKDVTLMVSVPDPRFSSVDIMGYEFRTSLSYSMKKKGRWQLASMISDGSYDGEQPVMYSKHQCIFEETPLLNLYMYDSISNRQIGCPDVSNRQLQTGRFNLKSVIYQMEKGDMTTKEKKTFEKHKNQRLNKERRSKKNCEDQSVIEEKPSTNSENLHGLELRQECVHIQEHIHVKDLSMVNMVKGCHYRCWNESKTRKNTWDNEISDDDHEFNEEESELNLSTTEDKSRPFVIIGSDFDCKDIINSDHKRKHKKKRSFIGPTYFPKKGKPVFVTEIIDDTMKASVEALNSQVMPFISIDVSRDQFINELKLMVSFCKCWVSGTNPLTILVDLDEFEESLEKSFILLKPTVTKDEDSLTVEVLFNIANNGFQTDVLDTRFNSVASVVEFVQSRLIPGALKNSSVLSNIIILEESSDNIDNLSHSRKIDNSHSLYQHHYEWRRCELRFDDVQSMMHLCGNLNYSIRECCACWSVVPEADMVLMRECQHTVCMNCLSNHIRLGIKSEELRCPSHGCGVYLDAPTILSSVHWRTYCERTDILKLVVLKMGGKPCHHCGSVLINEGCIETRDTALEYICVCGKTICRNCGELLHQPSLCDEMKKHNINMTKFENDVAKARKLELMILPENECSYCKTVLFPNCPHHKFTCVCHKAFCKKCRPFYEDHTASCKKFIDHKWTFPYTSEVIPYQKPQSPELKFYNHSVYLHILRRQDNLDRFNHELSRVASTALVTQGGSFSSGELTFSYSEILRILESMYVAAYSSYRKDHPRKLELLKVSTSHLLFYVGRIQLLIDELRHLSTDRGQRPSWDTVYAKYLQLQNHIDSATIYARKMVSPIKR